MAAPVTAPVWVRVLTGICVAALGGLVVWLQSLDPIIGLPVAHPASLTFLGLFGLAGLGVAVRPRGWERTPADRPEEAKRPADRGE